MDGQSGSVHSMVNWSSLLHGTLFVNYWSWCNFDTQVRVLINDLIPWSTGVLLYLIPNWATTRIVDGECGSFSFWPSRVWLKSYTVLIFVLLFIIPVIIFTYCYGHVIVIIRRQSQQVSSSSQQPNHQSSRKVSGSERKVIRTMLTVIISYFVVWFPLKFYIMAATFRWVPIISNMFYGLTLLSYVGTIINPVTYSLHFDVRRHIQSLICHVPPPDDTGETCLVPPGEQILSGTCEQYRCVITYLHMTQVCSHQVPLEEQRCYECMYLTTIQVRPPGDTDMKSGGTDNSSEDTGYNHVQRQDNTLMLASVASVAATTTTITMTADAVAINNNWSLHNVVSVCRQGRLS